MSDLRPDLVLLARRAVLPRGVRDAAVIVQAGRIASVVPMAAAPPAARYVWRI